MGRPKIEDDKRAFMKELPLDGSFIGNMALRAELGWTEQRYYRTKQALLEDESIVPGRGKGGSVARQRKEKKRKYNTKESRLYRPFKTALEKWADESMNLKSYIVEITASSGRRDSGVWSRPDLVLISSEMQRYVPGKSFEIMTFELKHEDSWDVTAVFEAAAHSRFATRSYLAVKRPAHLERNDLHRIETECSRLKIGLIYFSRVSDFGTYEFYLDAIRNEPDPREMDEFIHERIGEENREKIRAWVR